jgi:hypothetical protein
MVVMVPVARSSKRPSCKVEDIEEWFRDYIFNLMRYVDTLIHQADDPKMLTHVMNLVSLLRKSTPMLFAPFIERSYRSLLDKYTQRLTSDIQQYPTDLQLEELSLSSINNNRHCSASLFDLGAS